MNNFVLCQVVNWSLIHVHVYTRCHTGFYFGEGGGEYTQQEVWGGTALQTLKGVCIIRQLSLPFLIIHNTLS